MRRVALLALALFATILPGQTPDSVGRVAGGGLTGVVHDITGQPLVGIDVSLFGEAAATRTDSTGHFALRDIPPGRHTALFRRIGYRSVEYRWVAEAGREVQVAVTMSPAPRKLERIVVEASGVSRRRGTSSIGGTVSDSSGHTVEGADVRLLGSGLSTVTDSAGRFEFQMLAAGSYIIRVRRLGKKAANAVMQIVDGDNRGITLKMYGLPKNTRARDSASASGYGITDEGFDEFDRRERVTSAHPLLGPGDLFRANGTSLEVVLQQYRDLAMPHRMKSATVEQGRGSTDEGDCLLIDGRRATYQPLGSFRTPDVQLVEVFRANSFVDASVVSRMGGLSECRGGMDHHPSYFVLWTRALR